MTDAAADGAALGLARFRPSFLALHFDLPPRKAAQSAGPRQSRRQRLSAIRRGTMSAVGSSDADEFLHVCPPDPVAVVPPAVLPVHRSQKKLHLFLNALQYAVVVKRENNTEKKSVARHVSNRETP